MSTIENEYATREEAADHFRVSVDTLDRWRRAGKGPQAVKLPGGRIRYARKAIQEYDAALAASAS